LAEIRLKTVRRAQLNFRYQFWSNIVQVGQNSIHGWFFMRQFGRNFGQFGKISANFGVSSAKVDGGN
jgi:hypothetical protein